MPKIAVFSVIFLPVLYLIFTATASISSFPSGQIADKFGRKIVLFFSFLSWILVCIIFVFIKSFLAVIIAFVLYGLHKGSIDPVQRAFVSELSPKEYRASALGAFQMIIGLFALPASLAAGLLWDKINFNVPFYFSIALSLFSIILLIFVDEKQINQ